MEEKKEITMFGIENGELVIRQDYVTFRLTANEVEQLIAIYKATIGAPKSIMK